MDRILIIAIASVGGTFLLVTAAIVLNKAWRDWLERKRQRRRRVLEPRILRWAHGDAVSVLPAVDGELSRGDRPVVEAILLDSIQRVRGIERERMGSALEQLGFVEDYVQGLSSSRWWRRATCAERLGLSGAERAIHPLVNALNDVDSEVRLRAAQALGRLGGKAAVRPLIHALDEPNRWSTIRLSDILTGMGHEVVDELIGFFPELSRHGKLAALDILGRIRLLHSAEWLRERLDDFESDVRARACHALGEIGDPAAIDALIAAMQDADWPVRAMAAKALGKVRPKLAIPTLAEAMRDKEWWVRANAAEALRQCGEEGVQALRRMLHDRDTYAQHQAVLMIQEVGLLDEEVGRLANGDPTAQESAEALIQRLIHIGQTDRLRELAAVHPEAEVRRALDEMLAAHEEQAR